jgi:hypothetical protein
MIQETKCIFRPLAACVLFFTACMRHECKNENSIFEKFPADSKEYTNELVRVLKANEAKNISFFFDRYEKKAGNEFIFVDITGDKFCAKGKILVTAWNKIEEIQRTKGMGYSGAGLVGFTIDYLKDSIPAVLVYKNIDHISD